MAHLIDKHPFERANGTLLLSLVGGGLVACALGAMLYDVSRWLAAAW